MIGRGLCTNAKVGIQRVKKVISFNNLPNNSLVSRLYGSHTSNNVSIKYLIAHLIGAMGVGMAKIDAKQLITTVERQIKDPGSIKKYSRTSSHL